MSIPVTTQWLARARCLQRRREEARSDRTRIRGREEGGRGPEEGDSQPRSVRKGPRARHRAGGASAGSDSRREAAAVAKRPRECSAPSRARHRQARCRHNASTRVGSSPDEPGDPQSLDPRRSVLGAARTSGGSWALAPLPSPESTRRASERAKHLATARHRPSATTARPPRSTADPMGQGTDLPCGVGRPTASYSKYFAPPLQSARLTGGMRRVHAR